MRADANDKAEQQTTDIANLINQGAKVLIVLAKDSEAIKPAIADATAKGVKVIAYDRLIEDPNTFYITFDNKKVGTLMAQTLIGLVPKGNYAVILGAETDPNSAFLRSGMTEAGIPALNETNAAGIKVVFEKNTDNWDTTNAKNNMEQALNANSNKIDAVLSENDSMATGVVQALSAVGLKIPVSGQDGDTAALNRVAKGEQAVSVWKNAFALGQTAGDVAMQLCAGTALNAVKAPGDLPRRRGTGVARRAGVRDPRQEQRPVDHPHSDGDHQGKPEGHDRRRLDHEGRSVRRRGRWVDSGLQLTYPSFEHCDLPRTAGQVAFIQA